MIKNLHGPRNIQSIWKEINNRVKDANRFRIRHIETLEDILITGFIDWHKGLPSQSHGLRCNEIMYVQNVYDCTKIQWALLSPIMEVSYLSSLDWRDAAQKVKNSYRKNQNVHLSKYVEINRFDHSF